MSVDCEEFSAPVSATSEIADVETSADVEFEGGLLAGGWQAGRKRAVKHEKMIDGRVILPR